MDSVEAVAGLPETITTSFSTLRAEMLAALSTAQRDTDSEIQNVLRTMERLLCDHYERMSDRLRAFVGFRRKPKVYLLILKMADGQE